MNLYAYVANDPVNLVDPSGLLPDRLESFDNNLSFVSNFSSGQYAAFEQLKYGDPCGGPFGFSCFQEQEDSVPTEDGQHPVVRPGTGEIACCSLWIVEGDLFSVNIYEAWGNFTHNFQETFPEGSPGWQGVAGFYYNNIYGTNTPQAPGNAPDPGATPVLQGVSPPAPPPGTSPWPH